jgi:hypothetical protein
MGVTERRPALSKPLKNVFLTGPALLSWLSFSQGKGFIGSSVLNVSVPWQCIVWTSHIDPINKTPWNDLELFHTLRTVTLTVVLPRKGLWVERLAE